MVQQAEFSPATSVALVAPGARPAPGDLSLEVVHTLRRKGFQVIAFEEGAHQWPLGSQCRLLLAGALCVLDSSEPEFAPELVTRLKSCLPAEAQRLEEEEKTKSTMRRLGLVGESPAMLQTFRWALRVGPLSDLSVLITGETGTGKELLARAIFQLDPKRGRGPFVALNCSALNPGLAESELFGHTRGAFTGAERNRPGLIRSAQGGVFVLDEIGDLDLNLQTKLLRVLQENKVLGMGEDRETPVNVRILAATNRDLERAVSEGKFRADLYHRLNILSIRLPPLRERPEDLNPLVEYFAEKNRALWPAGSLELGADFLAALAELELPGNVRQLENLIRQALVHKEEGSALHLSDLPTALWQQLTEVESVFPRASTPREVGPELPKPVLAGVGPTLPLLNLLAGSGWNLAASLRNCERLFLEAALHQARGNQSQTARLLGISPRSVYNKLRKHQMIA